MLTQVVRPKLTLPYKLLPANVAFMTRFPVPDRVLYQSILRLQRYSANLARYRPLRLILPTSPLVRQPSLRRVEPLRTSLRPTGVRRFSVVLQHVVPELRCLLKFSRTQMAHPHFALNLLEGRSAVPLVRSQVCLLGVAFWATVAAEHLGGWVIRWSGFFVCWDVGIVRVELLLSRILEATHFC